MTHYQQRDGLTVQSIDDETLILDMRSEHIHQLNSSASFIWESVVQAPSLNELVELFASQFGIDLDTARSDVAQVIKQLSDMGLIVDRPV